MNNILKSSNFVKPTISGREYVESSFSNVSRIYKIDDCDVTVESSKPDIKQRAESLKGFYTAKGFNKIVENYESILGSEVPILTAEEYLRELKDIALSGDEVNLSNLNRWVIETIDTVAVANVIVIGLHNDGKYSLINEVFIMGEYQKTIEYDLEDLLATYTREFSLEPFTVSKG